MNVPPDIVYDRQETGVLDYVHYAMNTTDFYFVRNTSEVSVLTNISFRQRVKTPELWDPITGDIIPLPVYELAGEYTKIPFSIPPNGSFFVAFSEGKGSAAYESADGDNPFIQYTTNGFYFLGKGPRRLVTDDGATTLETDPVIMPIDGSWRVTFPENWGAPAEAVFDSLTSWTQHPDPGIRFFSGIAAYNKKFEFSVRLDDPHKVFVELGDLAEVAEVWLNGESMGIVWTEPHRLDITAAVKEGLNDLKIDIANTWSNRLTGDGITGEKFTETNITVANKFVTPWKDLPLKRSGLIGPVRIEVVRIVPNP